MDGYDQAKKQFENVIKSCLNRWFMESDLDAQDLVGVVIKAIDEWLDEEIIGFEPEEG